MLTSPDGSNFEEALCWKPTGKDAESFTETLLFSRSPCMRIGFRRVKFVWCRQDATFWYGAR